MLEKEPSGASHDHTWLRNPQVRRPEGLFHSANPADADLHPSATVASYTLQFLIAASRSLK